MKHKTITVETDYLDTMLGDACQAADIKRIDLLAHEILTSTHTKTKIVVWF